MYSYYNNNILKKNNGKSTIYPRIVSPKIPKKFTNINIYKDASTINNSNNFKFSKIPNITLRIKNNKMRNKSNIGNHLYNLNNNKFSTKNLNSNPIFINLNNNNENENQELYNIPNYNSLIQLWKDFGVFDSYQELFNMILNQLNEEEKEDLCNKEINELNELKKNIDSLVKEIQLRKKTLEDLEILNEKLGESYNDKDQNSNPNEALIKNVSDTIENLRQYTVNVCLNIKKIKSFIYEGHSNGKYDLDIIAKNFGFDKNYLVKMKEEMIFLKEGYIKSYFNIKNELTPFLLKASEKIDNSNGEVSYFHIVPISKELREKITLCNYYIYQELIYYQNSKMKKNKIKFISPIRSEKRIIKFNNNNKRNNYFDSNINIYKKKKNNNLTIVGDKKNYIKAIDKKEFKNEKDNKLNDNQDESNLFEEKGINIKDIISETNIQNKSKIINSNINRNNSGIISNTKNNSKNFDTNEKLSGPNYNKKYYIESSSKTSNKYPHKFYNVIIYKDYINYFIEKYFNNYYNQIPKQEKLMFNLQKDILSPMLNGISPFLLLVQEQNNNAINDDNENDNDNEIENMKGMCAFNYIYHENRLKIKINHISALTDFNSNEYVDELKIIYKAIFDFILTTFYFEEIFVEFSKNKKNEEILNIFINNLNFVEKKVHQKKNQNESNGGEGASNDEDNQLNYLLFKNKIQINDSIKKSMNHLFGNNLFHFFNSIILTNNEKNSDILNANMDEDSDDLYINITAINNIFGSNNTSNLTNLYQRINSLSELIKTFQQNKIDKEEIPLSIAENRFDIFSCVLSTKVNETLSNSSKLTNNHSFFNSKSFLDKNTGIFYNYAKFEKIYVLNDEDDALNFYFIANNSLSIFFIKFNNEEIKKSIFDKNIYIRINEIYKKLISSQNIEIFENKFIWIPCFDIYRHLKSLINNSHYTAHEYISISNKIITKTNNTAYNLLFNNNLKSFIIEPQMNNDIILDNDFVIGILNNASYFNELSNNKNDNSSINKGEEKKLSSNCSIKPNEDKAKIEDNKNKKNISSPKYPNIIFLNYIKRNDFINNNKKQNFS